MFIMNKRVTQLLSGKHIIENFPTTVPLKNRPLFIGSSLT